MIDKDNYTINHLIGEFILFMKGMGLWGEYKKIIYNNIECYRPYFKGYKVAGYELNYEEQMQCRYAKSIEASLHHILGFYNFIKTVFDNLNIQHIGYPCIGGRYCDLLFFVPLKNTRSGYYNISRLQTWCELFITYLKERGVYYLPIKLTFEEPRVDGGEIRNYLHDNKAHIWKY